MKESSASNNAPDAPTPERRYRYRFSAPVLALLIAALVLCGVGFALTTWQLTDFIGNGDVTYAFEWLKFAILYLVCLFLAVFLAAALIRAEYVLTERELCVRFGFVCIRRQLSEIRHVHLFKGAGKLAVYFDEAGGKGMAVVIRESQYGDFIKTLIGRNERIEFSCTTAEEEEEFKRKN